MLKPEYLLSSTCSRGDNSPSGADIFSQNSATAALVITVFPCRFALASLKLIGIPGYRSGQGGCVDFAFVCFRKSGFIFGNAHLK